MYHVGNWITLGIIIILALTGRTGPDRYIVGPFTNAFRAWTLPRAWAPENLLSRYVLFGLAETAVTKGPCQLALGRAEDRSFLGTYIESIAHTQKRRSRCFPEAT